MEGHNVKISSYNVEWYFENNLKFPSVKMRDFETKTKELAEIISKDKPSIIGLQEVEGKTVLHALRNCLQKNHNLNYRYICGKYQSKRTFQMVGMLILESEDIQILEYDSFLVDDNAPSVLAPYCKLPNAKQLIRTNAQSELFMKNMYLIVNIHGKKVLILNFHLKAGYETEAIAIREKEALIIQCFVHYLVDIHQNSFHAIILLGYYSLLPPQFLNFLINLIPILYYFCGIFCFLSYL